MLLELSNSCEGKASIGEEEGDVKHFAEGIST